LHDATVQLPAEHPAVPFATKQASPQPPQFWGSFVVVVSQPFAEFPSQSPLPAAQDETVQMLFTQAGVPPWGGQTLLQLPQLFTLVLVWTSHPSVTLKLQSW
jgi:hypothetical protein